MPWKRARKPVCWGILIGMVIAGMKRVGLAWEDVKIAPERQAQKLVGAKKPVTW